MNTGEHAEFLITHQVFPFHILNAQNRRQAAEAMEIHHLETGQTFALQPGDACRIAYGLGGRLNIQEGDGPSRYVTFYSGHPL